MADREAAERAVKDANPIIDGRKANVNLAYLGAKPRNNAQNGKFSAHLFCASFGHFGFFITYSIGLYTMFAFPRHLCSPSIGQIYTICAQSSLAQSHCGCMQNNVSLWYPLNGERAQRVRERESEKE